jgi:hypothetical protein
MFKRDVRTSIGICMRAIVATSLLGQLGLLGLLGKARRFGRRVALNAARVGVVANKGTESAM